MAGWFALQSYLSRCGWRQKRIINEFREEELRHSKIVRRKYGSTSKLVLITSLQLFDLPSSAICKICSQQWRWNVYRENTWVSHVPRCKEKVRGKCKAISNINQILGNNEEVWFDRWLESQIANKKAKIREG